MFALFCTILHFFKKYVFSKINWLHSRKQALSLKKIVQPFVKYSYVLNYIMKGNNKLVCQVIIKS